MKVQIEVTDLANGEANYAWVKRYELDLPDMSTTDYIVRKSRRHINWNGKRCVRSDTGDMVTLRPRGECVVCFSTYG